MCVVWIAVTKNKLYWCHGYLLVQNADCKPDKKFRLGTKCRLHTAEWVQNTEWESFWYMITCHLTTDRASRNRVLGDQLYDYLHYCGIFLAHFLIKIDLNIISSLHIVFSLCAQVGWCDVCTDFTNVIKVAIEGQCVICPFNFRLKSKIENWCQFLIFVTFLLI